jgi:DNA-binding NtrC family response regulator
MNNSIIIIDDEQDFLDSVRRGLLGVGFRNLKLFSDSRKAAESLRQGETFDIALIDITMPEVNGLEILDFIKTNYPATECIMVTAANEARIAIECLRKGAYEYLVKPISREDLVSSINRALEHKRLLEIVEVSKSSKRPEMINNEAFGSILFLSDKMRRLLKEAELHAVSDTPLLLTGESGTGKELLARAIHQCSSRAGEKFLSVNMASTAGSLFDAEFFGHTKGAFTGAEKERIGHLEYANNGTLFLDEIGDLPLDFQGKLLRVLQDGEFLKLGTSTPRRVDVRFIAATNSELTVLIARNLFRKDLYYRLKGAWLHIPPLRERREDIPLLINAFLDEIRPVCGMPQIDGDALGMLMGYDYPGNVRELRFILQSAANLSEGRVINRRCLPAAVIKKASMKYAAAVEEGKASTLPEVEKSHILSVYEQTGRNKVRTAKILDIGLNTLRRKLASYDSD